MSCCYSSSCICTRGAQVVAWRRAMIWASRSPFFPVCAHHASAAPWGSTYMSCTAMDQHSQQSEGQNEKTATNEAETNTYSYYVFTRKRGETNGPAKINKKTVNNAGLDAEKQHPQWPHTESNKHHKKKPRKRKCFVLLWATCMRIRGMYL